MYKNSCNVEVRQAMDEPTSQHLSLRLVANYMCLRTSQHIARASDNLTGHIQYTHTHMLELSELYCNYLINWCIYLKGL